MKKIKAMKKPTKMNDWKISKKISFSFTSILTIMILLAVFILAANLLTITNVSNIDSYSTSQTLANKIIDEFNTALISAETVSNIISESANEGFRTHSENADAKFNELISFLDSKSGLRKYLGEAQSAYDGFKSWKTEVESVIERNTALGKSRLELTDSGDELSRIGNILLTNQILILKGPTNLRYIDEISERFEVANNVGEAITSFRVDMAKLMQDFDTANFDETLAKMDLAVEHANNYSKIAAAQVNIDTANRVIKTVNTYKEIAIEFAAIADESYVAVDNANMAKPIAANGINSIFSELDRAMENQINLTRTMSVLSLVVVIILVMIAAIFVMIMSRRLTNSIVPPVELMSETAKQVGEIGNLDFSDEFREKFIHFADNKDEIGEAMGAFAKLIDRQREIGKILKRIASKDLTVEIKPLTDEDTVGKSLSVMISNLNEMFAEIQNVAREVSASSGGIANSASTLAQGSTEQASTIEQISASVTEINTQMKNNVSAANEASKYGDTINEVAALGKEKLSDMMRAVEDINESSAEISKVIKIIDSIAFQTNILALNAAVEAARAGEHGKGFAVVAEEVRNLASKSSAAAQETGELIISSASKSELGLAISSETAELLNEIIEGIEKTSDSLRKIAIDSEGSRASTEEVQDAIESMTEVISQNSATSEESAASSEQLRNMSAELQGLVDEFQLQNTLIKI